MEQRKDTQNVTEILRDAENAQCFILGLKDLTLNLYVKSLIKKKKKKTTSKDTGPQWV